MFEQFLACILGIVFGFIAGVLPGIGLSITMLIAFPILLKFTILQCLIFYACLASAAQFGGSVSAMITGLPGETNSFPLLSIRQKLIDDNQQVQALFMCAVGHVFGAVLIFTFSWFIINLLAQHTAYLRVYVLVALSFLGIGLTMWVSNNKPWVSILMVVLAWTLSKIGVDHRTGEQFLTFNNVYLSGGLPVISVITGVYAIPRIIEGITNKMKIDIHIQTKLKFKEMLSLIKANFASGVRGSTIGFFSGLIPYIGVEISAYLAFNFEKLINKRNHIAQITAAETATNGAAISTLLPLLIFGVAITVSENILLEAVSSSTQIINWKLIEPWFHYIALWLLVTNIVCFFLSWNFALTVMKGIVKLGTFAPVLFASVCIFAVGYVGAQYSLTFYYIATMALFTVIGFMLRKYDFLPFILVFLLQDKLEPAIIRLYLIYLT